MLVQNCLGIEHHVSSLRTLCGSVHDLDIALHLFTRGWNGQGIGTLISQRFGETWEVTVTVNLFLQINYLLQIQSPRQKFFSPNNWCIKWHRSFRKFYGHWAWPHSALPGNDLFDRIFLRQQFTIGKNERNALLETYRTNGKLSASNATEFTRS